MDTRLTNCAVTRELLRDIFASLKAELASTIDRFGLQIVDFHANWAPAHARPSQHEGFRPAGDGSQLKSGDGSTDLYTAATQGQTERALALISTGADIHARTDIGLTPCMWRLDMVKPKRRWR